MSDLLAIHEDVTDAADKRYEKSLEIGENEYDIVFRQARDPERSAFHAVVDDEEREKWRDAYDDSDGEMDEDDLKRFKELQLKQQNGRLDSDQEAELDTLREETKGVQNLMRLIAANKDTVQALQDIATKVVEPDEEDINEVLSMTPDVQQEKWGEYATDEAGAYELLNETVLPEVIYKSTDFSSIALGLQGLFIGQSAGHDPNE